MFFFLVGVATKRKLLDRSSAKLVPSIGSLHCLVCRQESPVAAVRDDTWLNIFFIPIVRLCRGTPYLLCHRNFFCFVAESVDSQLDPSAQPIKPMDPTQCPIDSAPTAALSCADWLTLLRGMPWQS